MLQGRTVLLYARVRADRPSVYRSTPDLHTLFYAILCVKFDITSVRTEMRNHPRQSEIAGYIVGKRGWMGVTSRSRGTAPGGEAGGEAPAGGWGEGPLAEQYFFILENTRKY